MILHSSFKRTKVLLLNFANKFFLCKLYVQYLYVCVHIISTYFSFFFFFSTSSYGCTDSFRKIIFPATGHLEVKRGRPD